MGLGDYKAQAVLRPVEARATGKEFNIRRRFGVARHFSSRMTARNPHSAW